MSNAAVAALKKEDRVLAIRNALDELDEAEYREILGEVVQRKMATTTAESDYVRNQKVARYAISRGFEPALVFPLVGSTDPFEE